MGLLLLSPDTHDTQSLSLAYSPASWPMISPIVDSGPAATESIVQCLPGPCCCSCRQSRSIKSSPEGLIQTVGKWWVACISPDELQPVAQHLQPLPRESGLGWMPQMPALSLARIRPVCEKTQMPWLGGLGTSNMGHSQRQGGCCRTHHIKPYKSSPISAMRLLGSGSGPVQRLVTHILCW